MGEYIDIQEYLMSKLEFQHYLCLLARIRSPRLHVGLSKSPTQAQSESFQHAS